MLLKYARRLVVFVMGGTVLLVGIAMLVLPGPALVVIPIGLAILATEYAWARRLLRIVHETAEKGADALTEHPLTGRWFRPIREFVEKAAKMLGVQSFFTKNRKKEEGPRTSPENS